MGHTVAKGKHIRNHSEILSAQFKKEVMFVDDKDDETNDKFNIDGNLGLGNITSSDEDFKNP